MSRWKIIAKKEIMQHTYFIRKNRLLYFILIYTLLIFWAFYLGPNLLDIVMPELLKDYTDILKPLISSLLEYFLTIIFLAYLMYPLYNLFRRSELKYEERILATPIKHGDIFLGEFVGQIPFYLIGVFIIGPLITAGLHQLIELTVLLYLVIYICFFSLMLFGLIVGGIIANRIEHFMVKSEKAQEWGKSFLITLAVLMIFIYYFFHIIFSYMVNNPEIKNWLMFFPSFWFSNIILYIIDPVQLNTYLLSFFSF